MNILLTGASGFIGRNTARALVAGGHQIKPVSRGAGLDFCAMLTPQHWLPHLEGVDAVINCVGILGESGSQRFEPLHTLAPTALFQACAQVGVRRVLQISALGADATAFSAYHLSKRAADDALRSLDLDWFVLRPSLIYGRGGTSAAWFMRLAAWPLIPVLGNGYQRLQPIHIGDVVATVLQCLTTKATRQTLNVVGSQNITYVQWIQWMRHAQGLPPAPVLHTPMTLAMAGARVGRYFSPLLQPDNLRMLQTSQWVDVQPLIALLGRLPQAFEPSLFDADGLQMAPAVHQGSRS
jgi:uncharacterized protein YbjT (DUF2867 family)